MLHLGLTGGIGSGKSVASSIFRTLGIPIYDSDYRAKWLMENEQDLVNSIKQLFGLSIYNSNGILDRKKIASQVFEQPELLSKLNGIVHPKVEADFHLWAAGQKNCPYIIKEAAIIIETGQWNKLDGVLLVTAPEELKIQRVMERDKVTREAVERRMKNQLTDADKIPFSDCLIINDGAQSITKQVLDIHKRILD